MHTGGPRDRLLALQGPRVTYAYSDASPTKIRARTLWDVYACVRAPAWGGGTPSLGRHYYTLFLFTRLTRAENANARKQIASFAYSTSMCVHTYYETLFFAT